MGLSKYPALEPIFSSKDGLHLSIFIHNTKRHAEVKHQVEECIGTAEELLAGTLSRSEIARFLAPVKNIFDDARTLKKFSQSIGLFRNERWFRAMSLPIRTESMTVLADTFHTKPLMRWLQQDQRFLLVVIGEDYAQMFSGSQSSFEFVDSLPLRASLDDGFGFPLRRGIRDQRKLFLTHWVNTALTEMGQSVPDYLFIGSMHAVDREFISSIRHPRIRVIDERPTSQLESSINFYRDETRKRMEYISESKVRKTLNEFRIARRMRRTAAGLKDVAKMAVAKQIERLLIAEDYEYFGRIDRKSGDVELNPIQLDHTDDDLLDDIAQIVKASGGEVVLAEQRRIPGRHAAVAILKNQSPELVVPVQYPYLERRA